MLLQKWETIAFDHRAAGTSSKIISPNLHRSVLAKQMSVCFPSNCPGAHPAVTKSLTHQTVLPERDKPCFLEPVQAFSLAFQPPVHGVHPRREWMPAIRNTKMKINDLVCYL